MHVYRVPLQQDCRECVLEDKVRSPDQVLILGSALYSRGLLVSPTDILLNYEALVYVCGYKTAVILQPKVSQT